MQGGYIDPPLLEDAKLIITALCADCGQTATLHIGQSVHDKKLYWHIASICSHCGYQTEMDDEGQLPEDLREPYLVVHGIWGLHIDHPADAHILKVLRAVLQLSLAEVNELRPSIPGKITTGTQAEMECLRQLLEADGVWATINRITDRLENRSD